MGFKCLLYGINDTKKKKREIKFMLRIAKIEVKFRLYRFEWW